MFDKLRASVMFTRQDETKPYMWPKNYTWYWSLLKHICQICKLLYKQLVLLCLATAVSFLLQEWKLCSHILAYFFRVEEDFTVKIADFSLSQLCQSSNKPDVGVKSRLQKKWTAPESLRDGLFSEKSDVVGSHFQFPNVCHLIIIHSSVCLFILLIISIYAKKKLPSSKVRQLIKAPVGLCQKPVSVVLDLTIIIDAVMVLTWEQFGLWFLDNSVIFIFFIFLGKTILAFLLHPLWAWYELVMFISH